ncbi:MAG TPA: type II secretion system protein GspG [Opitutaceae bacterium]
MKLRTAIPLLGVCLVAAFLVVTTRFCACSDQATTAHMFVQQTIQAPLATFRLQLGRFPTTAEGLGALFTCPPGSEGKWQGPYVEGRVPLDPWGQPYQYRYPATTSSRPYDVWSLGPDRVPSADDIGNWQMKT